MKDSRSLCVSVGRFLSIARGAAALWMNPSIPFLAIDIVIALKRKGGNTVSLATVFERVVFLGPRFLHRILSELLRPGAGKPSGR